MESLIYKNIYIKKINVVFIFILFSFNISYGGSPGSSGALFLNYSPSARASAMANSFSSVTDDVFSVYYNPAGLVNVEMIEIGASYIKSFENMSNQYLGIAYPYKAGRVFGFSYHSFSNGDIDSYDAMGASTGKKVDTSNKAITFSYSKAFTKDEIERPVLEGGANLKYISQTLDAVSAQTFAFDVGVIYNIRPDKYWLKEVPAQEFRVAAALKNFGPALKFDKETTPLPFSFNFGGSWISHPWGKHKLILSLDNVISSDDKYKILFGAEYFLFQLLSVRLGYESSKTIGSSLSFGVGFRLSFIDIDYSIGNYGDLGNINKINIIARFGERRPTQPLVGEVTRIKEAKQIAPKEKIEKLEMFASDFIKLAEDDIVKVDYVNAIDHIKKAFNLEPGLKKTKWDKILKRLERLVSELKLDTTPKKIELIKESTEQAALSRDVIKEWLQLNDKKAYLLAHIMYGTNPKGPSVFEELLQFIAKEYGFALRTDEFLAKDAWIVYKLKKSAGYFYMKQYNMVVENCSEIIIIDPTNHIALTRLGSAYFMLGDKENAKHYYEKALEINPNDTITLEFMKKQGWK